MKDRILEFLRHENKTSSQFADEIGVQASSISHIISGRNKPSLDFIIKMLQQYEDLSTDWLIFGKGDMFKIKKDSDLFNSSINPDTDSLIDIDKPDISQSADKELVSTRKDIESSAVDNSKAAIERVILVYTDGTFKELKPS